MMTENLTEMLKTETDNEPVVFSENDLDIPDETEGIMTVNEEVEEIMEVQTQAAPAITVTTLGEWFERNNGSFTSIKKVGLQVTGVDPKEDLVLTVPHESGELMEDKTPKRRLMKIDDANTVPVLNLQGIDMQVYHTGFRIINQFNDDVCLKCYGTKTGLIVTFCKVVEDQLIPYAKSKIGKKSKDLQIIECGIDVVTKASENLDKETLVLLYKQVNSDIDNLTTNMDAVKYLTQKQSTIRDINHHVQIDSAIIELFKR